MRFAIIGAGVIGTVHARLIDSLPDQDATLAAVVDIVGEKAAALAEQYGATALTELEQAISDPSIDAVAICVPSGLHPELAIRAITAGKHVLIEKPIGIRNEDARRLALVAKQHDVTVAMVSQRRFQPAPRFVRDSVTAGHLGQITSAVVESPMWRSQDYYDSGDWRGTWQMDGGGALMNQGIHALDLMIWMLGELVTVTAQAGTVAHERIEVEDVVGATIGFANGAIGVLLATTSAYPEMPVRLAVHGTQGTVVLEDSGITHFASALSDGADAPRSDDPHTAEINNLEDAHRRQYVDLIEAVREGREPFITVADGCRALSVVLAVYESARTGQPVNLRKNLR